ncbi:MAG TPA: hypothetical protein ENN68_04270 [Methanomicrobia archaeon]|nr:hypothetical protein [Methanomicrobia archaeon]
MRDFTVEKYEQLCTALLESGYKPQTVYSYLTGQGQRMSVILRHDIDRKLKNALRIALVEHDLGIPATYYFRYPYTFHPKVIKVVHDLGHEVGYHYEVLSKAKGDYEKAIELFKKEIAEFKKIVEIKTICMHGSPLSKIDNRYLWSRYDFRDFNIDGEAYLSVKDVTYFSDTGRSWNLKNKLRDFMSDQNEGLVVNATDDLIEVIKGNHASHLYILAHPERWTTTKKEWILSSAVDLSVNIGKKFLFTRRENA